MRRISFFLEGSCFKIRNSSLEMASSVEANNSEGLILRAAAILRMVLWLGVMVPFSILEI